MVAIIMRVPGSFLISGHTINHLPLLAPVFSECPYSISVREISVTITVIVRVRL